MIGHCGTIAARWTSLCRDHRGIALVEFAYVLPIFVLLSLTGSEIANYAITRMRISQLALQIADNAARIGSGSQLQAKTINEGDINDLLTGAQTQAAELDLFGRGRVIVTSLEPATNPNSNPARYKIGWQRCRGSKSYASPYTNQTGTFTDGLGPSTPVDRRVTAPDGGATMFVEIAYTYRPLIVSSPFANRDIREFASMMVRDRRDTTQVYPVANVTASTC